MGRGSLAYAGASLQPWHSFLKGFAEVASGPEGCLAQPSNLGLGLVPELPIPAPLRCGEGKGHPEQCGRIRLHAHKKKYMHVTHQDGEHAMKLESSNAELIFASRDPERTLELVLLSNSELMVGAGQV